MELRHRRRAREVAAPGLRVQQHEGLRAGLPRGRRGEVRRDDRRLEGGPILPAEAPAAEGVHRAGWAALLHHVLQAAQPPRLLPQLQQAPPLLRPSTECIGRAGRAPEHGPARGLAAEGKGRRGAADRLPAQGLQTRVLRLQAADLRLQPRDLRLERRGVELLAETLGRRVGLHVQVTNPFRRVTGGAPPTTRSKLGLQAFHLLRMDLL
mmetsp:Transcript_129704/g.315071  ORF Transcript_129704/g.315071 Transcript_129704/m.315071 type:complete len:209 (-) Transcript_129704:707-1333(-)